MRFSIFQQSKTGGRRMNQDRMGYAYTRESLLMVVADGMGGHLRGEVAAQIALDTIATDFQKAANPALASPKRFLNDSLLHAHARIMHYKTSQGMPEPPRTTVVACVVQDGHAQWAHAGDSRLYWVRRGRVLGQTRDHSKLEEMVRHGLVTQDEGENHPDRNKLFNCLGSPNLPTIELSRKAQLVSGDTLLLCSDGLWATLPEATLLASLSANSVMRAVPELVRMALNLAGASSDNVTALAMSWDGSDALEASDTLPLNADMPTLSLGSGRSTTIQAIPPGGVAGDATLSDDDIERAIDEIRESIRNTNRTLSKGSPGSLE